MTKKAVNQLPNDENDADDDVDVRVNDFELQPRVESGYMVENCNIIFIFLVPHTQPAFRHCYSLFFVLVVVVIRE